MKKDWIYTAAYSVFGDRGKATRRSPTGNLIRLIISQSKGFMREEVNKISNSVRAYIYLFSSYFSSSSKID